VQAEQRRKPTAANHTLCESFGEGKNRKAKKG